MVGVVGNKRMNLGPIHLSLQQLERGCGRPVGFSWLSSPNPALSLVLVEEDSVAFARRHMPNARSMLHQRGLCLTMMVLVVPVESVPEADKVDERS